MLGIPFTSEAWFQWILALILHCFLIGVHIVLFILQRNPPRPHTINNPRATDALAIAITSGPAAFIKIYSIFLVYLTQRLAFNRDFRRELTLSAFNDKTVAWSGIYSAYNAIWSQRRVRVARMAVFLILVYLLCIFALGLTTPAMINVAQVGLNQTLFTHTTAYLGQVGVNDIIEAYPIVSALPMIDVALNTYGFDTNTIYDIPQSGGGSTINVQAVWFNVGCQNIDSPEQSGNYSIQNGTIQYPFTVAEGLVDLQVSPAPRSLNILAAKPKNMDDDPPLTMFVASSVPILDESGEQAFNVSYYPPIDCGEFCEGSNLAAHLEIIACDIQVSSGTVSMDEDDGFLTTIPGSDPRFWKSWNLAQAPQHAILTGLSNFSAMSPMSDNPQRVSLMGSNVTGTFLPTMLEDNVMEWIGLYDPEVTSFPLQHLELVLEEALAMVYWRAGYRIAIRALASQIDNGAEQAQIGLQIQINKFMPIFGFFVSLILTVNFILLTVPSCNRRVVGVPSLIQLPSLFSGFSSTELLDGAEKRRGMKELDALRAAGTKIKIYVRDGDLKVKAA